MFTLSVSESTADCVFVALPPHSHEQMNILLSLSVPHHPLARASSRMFLDLCRHSHTVASRWFYVLERLNPEPDVSNGFVLTAPSATPNMMSMMHGRLPGAFISLPFLQVPLMSVFCRYCFRISPTLSFLFHFFKKSHRMFHCASILVRIIAPDSVAARKIPQWQSRLGGVCHFLADALRVPAVHIGLCRVCALQAPGRSALGWIERLRSPRTASASERVAGLGVSAEPAAATPASTR
jgi:hypothetical protein